MIVKPSLARAPAIKMIRNAHNNKNTIAFLRVVGQLSESERRQLSSASLQVRPQH